MKVNSQIMSELTKKAKEIVDKYYTEMNPNAPDCNISYRQAKQCAIIHVDGIIEIIKYHGTDIGKHLLLFYKKVKQEIEKL